MKAAWRIVTITMILLGLILPVTGQAKFSGQVLIENVVLPGRTMKTLSIGSKKPVTVKVSLQDPTTAVGSLTVPVLHRHGMILGEGVHISVQRFGEKILLINEGQTSCNIEVSETAS